MTTTIRNVLVLSSLVAACGSSRPGAARIGSAGGVLSTASAATITFKVEDGNVRVSEIEHAAGHEVRHQLGTRRDDARGEVEVQVEHLTEVEVEHGLTCSADCGTGFECDDGVCKAHQEDDPATHDVGDDEGGSATTPQPGDDEGHDGPGHGERTFAHRPTPPPERQARRGAVHFRFVKNRCRAVRA